ncbi:MAG TPA: hypothetical protein VF158_02655 [Longimicrobiales bacterium]
MFGAVVNAIGYARKPRAGFIVKHPLRAVRILRFRHGVKEAFTPRRIALGLGAATVAVPLGLWIGRKLGGS